MNKRMSARFVPAVVTAITLSTFVRDRAEAGVYIHPSAMYLEQSSKTPQGTEATGRRTLVDLSAGYSFEKGWAIGLLYGSEKGKTITSYTDSLGNPHSTTTDSSRSSMGPSVGWISQKESGPYALATYFFSSDFDSSPYSYKGGGFQFDLGFRFAIKRAFMSLQLSYKSFTYTKYSYSSTSTELSSPLTHQFIDPYFGVFFQF